MKLTKIQGNKIVNRDMLFTFSKRGSRGYQDIRRVISHHNNQSAPLLVARLIHDGWHLEKVEDWEDIQDEQLQDTIRWIYK